MEATRNPVFRNRKVISNGTIGMVFVLVTVFMFFAGLISALIVNRAGAVPWPPEGQPRLPVEITALNTIILLSSILTLFLFGCKFNLSKKSGLLVFTILLGAVFLFIQGNEWLKLIAFGLTTKSSLYGAFFYIIIGAHALHVVAGICILAYLFLFLRKNQESTKAYDTLNACSMYWYFVTGIWPILYWLVYLS